MTNRKFSYLFVVPSFGRGASRVLDLGATAHCTSFLFSRTPAQADAAALANDWRHVGEDLMAAAQDRGGDSER